MTMRGEKDVAMHLSSVAARIMWIDFLGFATYNILYTYLCMIGRDACSSSSKNK